MQEDDEEAGGGIALGRTLALSDGIFAIAMTLLAFQIQPPDLHGSQIHHLASALGALGSSYFVYVLSFAVIGSLWLAHHRIFRHVRPADGGSSPPRPATRASWRVSGTRRPRLLSSHSRSLWPWLRRPWLLTRGWSFFRSDS
jgi:hypothetical protein